MAVNSAYELHRLYWKDFRSCRKEDWPAGFPCGAEERHAFYQRLSCAAGGNFAYRVSSAGETLAYLFYQQGPEIHLQGRAFLYPVSGMIPSDPVKRLLFERHAQAERCEFIVVHPDSASRETVSRADHVPLFIWQERLFAVAVFADDRENELIRLDLIAEGSHVTCPAIRSYLRRYNCLDSESRYRGAENVIASGERAVPDVLLETQRQIREYMSGSRTRFQIPYRFESGTPFQRKVWHELEKIPYGTTKTYLEIAEAICKPGQKAHNYARAVGSACGANPIGVIVPCHRVIGGNGDLTGFASGVEVKANLLQLELFNYSKS